MKNDMVITEKFGYEKHNTDTILGTDKKRICAYFVVVDLHKITEVDIRFRKKDLFEEMEKHDDWILESVVWDANHRIDTNREGLNLILEKAKNDEFDILLLHHVTLISRSGSKTFDWAVQLHLLGKSVYGIVDGIHSFDELAEALHLTIARQKQYEEIKKMKNSQKLEEKL